MEDYSSNQVGKPLVRGISCFLAHVPSMIRHGSKPSREIQKGPSLLPTILDHLWVFDKAVAYLPNQVFIVNLDPDDLLSISPPWYKNLIPNASRWGAFGEIIPEEEFYGMMKISDEFGFMLLERHFLEEIALGLKSHSLFNSEDVQKLGKGVSSEEIDRKLSDEHAMPLYIQRDRLVGCLQKTHEEDPSLVPEILIENLSARASRVLALRRLIAKTGEGQAIDYLLGYGEEAVGDRYNRGGGNLAKAIGELSGCNRTTGSDVKAFCCAPIRALMLAAGLVASKVFSNVALVS